MLVQCFPQQSGIIFLNLHSMIILITDCDFDDAHCHHHHLWWCSLSSSSSSCYVCDHFSGFQFQSGAICWNFLSKLFPPWLSPLTGSFFSTIAMISPMMTMMMISPMMTMIQMISHKRNLWLYSNSLAKWDNIVSMLNMYQSWKSQKKICSLYWRHL